jgi:peptidoglycan/LPS O-acetylase OafA/YrhL
MSWDVLPARSDGFALGALLAVIMAEPARSDERRRNVSNLLVLTAAIAGSVVVLYFWVRHDVGAAWRVMTSLLGSVWIVGPINALFFGLIGIIVLNAGHRWLVFLRSRPLVYIGMISYGLYLYHIPVMFAVEAIFRKLGGAHPLDGSRPWFRSLFDVTLSVAVAALSWRWIERPILRLKDRFRYREAAPRRSPACIAPGAIQ